MRRMKKLRLRTRKLRRTVKQLLRWMWKQIQRPQSWTQLFQRRKLMVHMMLYLPLPAWRPQRVSQRSSVLLRQQQRTGHPLSQVLL